MVDALYKASRVAILDSLPEQGVRVGGLTVMHTTGSDDPLDPHYHFIVLVSPIAWAGGDDGLWVSLDHWWEQDGPLTMLRKRWTGSVRRVFRGVVDLDDCMTEDGLLNVRREYRTKREQMTHTLRYELRAPMQDLWKGMTRPGRYERRGGRGRPLVRCLDEEQVAQYLRDEEQLRKGFRRVRWFGYLAPNQRPKRLPSLGFVRGTGDEDGESDWKPDGHFQLVEVDDARGVVVMARDVPYYRVDGERRVRHERVEVPVGGLADGNSGPVRVVSGRPRWARPPDD
jgi:hypothetical protein